MLPNIVDFSLKKPKCKFNVTIATYGERFPRKSYLSVNKKHLSAPNLNIHVNKKEK